MLIGFYASVVKDREREIAEALRIGVGIAGDRLRLMKTAEFDGVDSSIDVACVFALKGSSRKILEAYRAAGKRTLLFDKGLTRASTGLGASKNEYYRVGLDEFMPLSRIRRQMTSSPDPHRWDALGVSVRPRVRSETNYPVIYCGSSQKYCDFHDLGDEHAYAEGVIEEIRQYTDRPICYRPKPSFHEAAPIKGTSFSHGKAQPTLAAILGGAYAVVTHGSHAGIDSVVGGVPVITLGPCAARPVANHSIARLSAELFYPDSRSIERWLAALAYWQWTTAEMASGLMWRWLREEMEVSA